MLFEIFITKMYFLGLFFYFEVKKEVFFLTFINDLSYLKFLFIPKYAHFRKFLDLDKNVQHKKSL